MASGDLRDELNCSICLSPYTDAVSLRCGHSFCRSCIVRVQDTQDESGMYSCPDCRAEYPERPPLQKRIRLDNTVEETRIFCTYCIKSPLAAVQSCLQCENSLCDDHLTAHNKTMDHVLMEPTGSFEYKKCPIHKKVLEYFCQQDTACLCVSCCLVGQHRGHQVELLDEASEKKKNKLRKNLHELNAQKVEIPTEVQNLQDQLRNIQEKASNKRKDITKIFMDIKEQLEMAEKKALSEISTQEEKIVSQISDQIRKLEIKEDKLSRKMLHLQEICRVNDPIRLLQESDITECGHGDGEDTGEERKIKSENAGPVSKQADVYICDTKVQDNETVPKTVLQKLDQAASCSDKRMAAEEAAPVTDHHEIADDLDERGDERDDDLDEVLISLTLHRSIKDIVRNVTSQLGFQTPNILLDDGTVQAYVGLSRDLKTAKSVTTEQKRPNYFTRFQEYPQVLSRSGLSSGRHYWEVKWNKTGTCGIGVSYPSIEREGDESCIGENGKSWCLRLEHMVYAVVHNTVMKRLDLDPTSSTLAVFLDCEVGRLSFYELCDPIRHLHTFSASFTEPLHVIFYVDDGAAFKIIR